MGFGVTGCGAADPIQSADNALAVWALAPVLG